MIEVFWCPIQRRPVTGRAVSGTLPGRCQTGEGAETYALLQWLRHLDPASPLQPKYHSDSERVVDGWHRRWDTTAAFAPNRGVWQQIELARENLHTEVQVKRVHSHRPRAGPTEAVQTHAFGNRVADCLAREAAGRHPHDEVVERAARRSADFACRLGRFYARLLDWAISGDRLPEVDPFYEVFRNVRPPAIPEHTIARDKFGQPRCVRCLFPAGVCDRVPCKPAGINGHCLVQLGTGHFCKRCGAFCFKALRLLAGQCKGRPSDQAADWRLRRMLSGRHPVTGAFVGTPCWVDGAAETFHIILGEDE